MISQDVIHSFYVPAFRIKQDVLPGRYTVAWFKATRIGEYHLFCAEYCGTDHAAMLGTVTVMRPEDYAAWLEVQPQPEDPAARGAALYRSQGCSGCHEAGSRVRAPSLAGIYGSIQPLADGSFVHVDEAYLRDALMLPQKQVVASYAPVMPSYQGSLDEDQIIDLIAYLKAKTSGRSMAR
jgi:cytochrome c oxidase subunit 2